MDKYLALYTGFPSSIPASPNLSDETFNLLPRFLSFKLESLLVEPLGAPGHKTSLVLATAIEQPQKVITQLKLFIEYI